MQEPQHQEQQRPGLAQGRLSKLYSLVMTPINLVTFLFALCLVDIQYSVRRSNIHAKARSRLPNWLSTLLYERQPYGYMAANGIATPQRQGHEQWHYSTKQKKLMRVEAEDAFRLRGTVLGLMAIIVAGITAMTWFVVSRLFHRVRVPA